MVQRTQPNEASPNAASSMVLSAKLRGPQQVPPQTLWYISPMETRLTCPVVGG